MIFQHTWRKIPTNEKTETSRIAQDSDQFTILGGWTGNEITPSAPMSIAHLNLNHTAYSVVRSGRTLYHVGQVLSVQPARTKPTIWWREEAFGMEYAHENYTLWNDQHDREVATGKQRSDYVMLYQQSEKLLEHGYHPLQIRITRIRHVDVRQMTLETAQREGFATQEDFWNTWVMMHDKQAKTRARLFLEFGAGTDGRVSDGLYSSFRVEHHDEDDNISYSYTLAAYLKTRPAERYRAWSLQFELLK